MVLAEDPPAPSEEFFLEHQRRGISGRKGRGMSLGRGEGMLMVIAEILRPTLPGLAGELTRGVWLAHTFQIARYGEYKVPETIVAGVLRSVPDRIDVRPQLAVCTPVVGMLWIARVRSGEEAPCPVEGRVPSSCRQTGAQQ